jgi:O-antigen ligase
MFSSEFDKIQVPIASRGWGIVLGSIILVTVAAALVSARTVPFLYALTCLSFVVAAAARGQLGHAVPQRGPVFWHLASFLVYAALTATWSAEPLTALLNISLVILVAVGTFVLVQLFEVQKRPDLLHMGEGLWVGLSVALAYLMVEVLTGQSIKIWLYNSIGIRNAVLAPAAFFSWSGGKLIAISLDDLTRNMAVLTLLLWPAVLAMRGTLPRPWTKIMPGLVWVTAGVVVMLSTHESSKLAFLGGAAAFACAWAAPRLTGRLAAASWIIACIAVLPLALLAHRYNLHNATWLQDTARHRIIIWNYTAEQVLKKPWLGVGARTTYVLGPRLEAKIATAPDEAFKRTLSTHSHSVYLQTWFELGLIGVTLLTLLGLSILQAIRSLALDLQRYAYATFASAALMAASSYGMWQIWFATLFGLCAAMFGLGATLVRTRSATS